MSCLPFKRTRGAQHSSLPEVPCSGGIVLSPFFPIPSRLGCLSSGDLTTLCQLLNPAERQGSLRRAFDRSGSLITMDEYANETSTLSSTLLLTRPA